MRGLRVILQSTTRGGPNLCLYFLNCTVWNKEFLYDLNKWAKHQLTAFNSSTADKPWRLTWWTRAPSACVPQPWVESARGWCRHSPSPPWPALSTRPRCAEVRSCVSAPSRVLSWLWKKHHAGPVSISTGFERTCWCHEWVLCTFSHGFLFLDRLLLLAKVLLIQDLLLKYQEWF